MGKASQVRSIIVGVDFSKHSKSAVLQARSLAKKWNAPLTFVHGFEDPVVSEVRFGTIIRSLTHYHEKRIAKIYKVSGSEKVVVRCGRPYEIIIKAAGREPHPIIIMGHQGATSRFEKWFLGSTAERVAQKSPYPVWIHRGASVTKMSKALVPCDLTDRAAHTLEFLKKNNLGRQKSELFHAIRYATPVMDLQTWREMSESIEKENRHQLKKFKKMHPSLKVIETHGDVFSCVEKRAKNFDFIALTPRVNKGFFAGFGSVTSSIVRQSQKPILIVP